MLDVYQHVAFCTVTSMLKVVLYYFMFTTVNLWKCLRLTMSTVVKTLVQYFFVNVMKT